MPAETYSMTCLRIRTPHRHDVLSGRGGGINMHTGNKIFREWVAERKEEYNLAPNKVEKTRVAMEVMERVRNQNPPGRFLTRDPTAGSSHQWWVEVDEGRALAKTSQALREGAPQIRLAHKDELLERATQVKPRRNSAGAKRKRKPAHQVSSLRTAPGIPHQRLIKRLPTNEYNNAMENLQANARNAKELAEQKERQQQTEQQEWDPSAKRLRFETPHVSPGNNRDDDETHKLLDSLSKTPSLLTFPTPANIGNSYMEDLNLNSPAPSLKNLPRVHSLALSDWSMSDTYVFDDDGEFVNPFEDESGIANKVMKSRLGGSSNSLSSRPYSTAEYLRNLSSNEDINPEPHHVEPYHSDEHDDSPPSF